MRRVTELYVWQELGKLGCNKDEISDQVLDKLFDVCLDDYEHDYLNQSKLTEIILLCDGWYVTETYETEVQRFPTLEKALADLALGK